ncbi:ribosomal protein L22 [Bradyrhizobium sp. LB7.1]
MPLQLPPFSHARAAIMQAEARLSARSARLLLQRLNGDLAKAAIDYRHHMWGCRCRRRESQATTTGVLTEALATALVALEQLETKHQPNAHMDDIRKMLSNGKEPAAVSLHLAQAKCRLFPDLDPLEIYREYGIGDEYG